MEGGKGRAGNGTTACQEAFKIAGLTSCNSNKQGPSKTTETTFPQQMYAYLISRGRTVRSTSAREVEPSVLLPVLR